MVYLGWDCKLIFQSKKYVDLYRVLHIAVESLVSDKVWCRMVGVGWSLWVAQLEPLCTEPDIRLTRRVNIYNFVKGLRTRKVFVVVSYSLQNTDW